MTTSCFALVTDVPRVRELLDLLGDRVDCDQRTMKAVLNGDVRPEFLSCMALNGIDPMGLLTGVPGRRPGPDMTLPVTVDERRMIRLHDMDPKGFHGDGWVDWVATGRVTVRLLEDAMTVSGLPPVVLASPERVMRRRMLTVDTEYVRLYVDRHRLGSPVRTLGVNPGLWHRFKAGEALMDVADRLIESGADPQAMFRWAMMPMDHDPDTTLSDTLVWDSGMWRTVERVLAFKPIRSGLSGADLDRLRHGGRVALPLMDRLARYEWLDPLKLVRVR